MLVSSSSSYPELPKQGLRPMQTQRLAGDCSSSWFKVPKLLQCTANAVVVQVVRVCNQALEALGTDADATSRPQAAQAVCASLCDHFR